MVGVVRRFVTLRVDVPTLAFWRMPEYVLWGARRNDEQVGGAADLARQAYLNRRAEERRRAVLAVFILRDNVTPRFKQLSETFELLAKATVPAAQSMSEFGERYRQALKQANER